MSVTTLKCLNLGCGNHFHSDWQNVDFCPADPSIQVHDLRYDLPFPDTTFDVVYHSHVMEHFTPSEGRRFIGECFRVLRTSGTLRVVVPDLELLATRYLQTLSAADIGNDASLIEHQWSIIQLVDQCTRETSGGEMVKFLRDVPIENLKTFSATSSTAMEHLRCRQASANKRSASSTPTITARLRRIASLVRRLPKAMPRKHNSEVGNFRMSGEPHKWMYDRISLKAVLKDVGFSEIRVVHHLESAIARWEEFQLDTNSDGSIYKPDSLIVECTKPATT
ncbi:class I SAM-dependent methyltransferase [Allorhodopirellula heiligendammensis]|nr:methyltransferase domain-containing protein [Allorhodopirellula heiligendammensis]